MLSNLCYLQHTGEDMKIMDHCRASQIEQVLAPATIARPPSLPTPHMGQGMFDRDTLAQFGPARWRLLTRPQLTQQPFIRMHRETAAMDTVCQRLPVASM